MQLKYPETRKLDSRLQSTTGRAPAAGAAEGSTTVEERSRGTLVHHGIHAGTYPLSGMSVAQARRVLGFMNVAPDAVAVIGGEIVADEAARMIDDSVELLSFVQRSSVKGQS